ncbi:MAG: winged helix-turn-helix domain-containing protein [Nitrososphaera sp.]
MVSRGIVSHRNRTDIAIQILGLANGGGITKYQIAYRAFLNYGHLKEVLTELIESDLLSYDSTMHTFRTTEKGLTFLQAYNHMNAMLKEGRQQQYRS